MSSMRSGPKVEYAEQLPQAQIVWGVQQSQSGSVCKLKENLNVVSVKHIMNSQQRESAKCNKSCYFSFVIGFTDLRRGDGVCRRSLNLSLVHTGQVTA
jgi:hypothetical protein